MKKLTVIFFFLGVLVFAQKPSKVLPASSSVQFWMHQVVDNEPSSNMGTIKVKSGKFTFGNNSKIEEGEVLLDMRSLTNSDLPADEMAALTKRLRSSDYFFVKKYPFAKFTLKKIESRPNEEFNSIIWADLSMHGRTHTITFPANVMVNGKKVSIESDKFQLNRQDYDIFYRSSRPNIFIKDEIVFKLTFVTK